MLTTPQVFLYQAAFHLGGPQHVSVPRGFPTQVQVIALPLAELSEVSGQTILCKDAAVGRSNSYFADSGRSGWLHAQKLFFFQQVEILQLH